MSRGENEGRRKKIILGYGGCQQTVAFHNFLNKFNVRREDATRDIDKTDQCSFLEHGHIAVILKKSD